MSSAPLPDWRETLIVEAALRSGLLAEFLRPATPEAASDALGLDARASRIVALALSRLGYLEPAGLTELALGARGLALLDEHGAEREEAARVHHAARLIALHLGLGPALAGERQPAPWGDDALPEFIGAMRLSARERVEDLVAALVRPRDGARLLDVGGAPGVDAAALAAAGWDVTVLDLPRAIALVGDRLSEAGVVALAGDATEELPDGPWDAILMGNLLQLLGRADAEGLVGRAAARLAPGGTLAVLGVLRDLSPHGPLFAVTMLLVSEAGDAHDSESLAAWMAAAGLVGVRTVELAGGRMLMLGDRP